MLTTLSTATTRRDRRCEAGFTLIELMVVVLIIAILIAIAIPTFLGARTKANDRAAQSSLRNALTGAKSVFVEDETYTAADPAALLAAEPSITFQEGGNSSGPKEVSVGARTQETWVAAALSKSDTCYFIRDDASDTGPGTTYASVPSSGGACDGASPPALGAFDPAGW